jgi:hypothetical protein
MRRGAKIAVAAVGAASATLAAIAVNIATGGEAVTWNDPVWLLVILATAGTGAISYLLTSPGRASLAVTTSEASSNLSRMLETQWRNEEDFQHIQHPYPLPLSWRNAPTGLVDQWANIRSTDSDSRAGRIPLAGSLPHIASVFHRVPSHRFVILGGGGSGKSVLCRRLGLDLLSARTADGRVPAIFQLRSWNPRQFSFQDWLARQLGQDHPSLVALTPSGSTLAAALISEDRVLPILDGFDEVPEGLRHDVIRMLSETSGPFVLTSRTTEYAAHARHHPIAKAAAIELLPLELGTVADYLRRTTRDNAGQLADEQTGWARFFSALETADHADRRATLASVFSTPLMVSLAGSIYQDPAKNPAELLDSTRFPERSHIESGLLHGFLPAVYRTTKSPGLKTSWNEPTAGLAEKYLRTIAEDLERRGESTISWWTMPEMVNPRVRGGIIGVLAGVAVLAGSLAVGWTELGTTFSVSAACAVSIVTSVCFGGAPLGVRPASVRLVPRADWRMLLSLLAVSGLAWLTIWLFSPPDGGFNASILHHVATKASQAAGDGVGDALEQVIEWMPRYYTSWCTVGAAVGLSAWLVGHVSRTRKSLRSFLFLATGALTVGCSTFVVNYVLLVDEGGTGAALREAARAFSTVMASAFVVLLAAVAVGRKWGSRRGRDYFIERALTSFGFGMMVSLLFSLGFGLLGIVTRRQAATDSPNFGFDTGPTPEQIAFAQLPTFVQHLYELSSAVLGGIDFGLPAGFAMTLGAGIALSLVGTFTAPLDVRVVPSAEYLFKQDRISSIVLLLTGGMFAGVLAIEIDTVAARFVMGFVISAVFVMVTTAWGRWAIFVQVWMALVGRLPWSAMAFLKDAHQRGVLRQSGGGYQFRHSAIQRHLAGRRATAVASPSTSATTSTTG